MNNDVSRAKVSEFGTHNIYLCLVFWTGVRDVVKETCTHPYEGGDPRGASARADAFEL